MQETEQIISLYHTGFIACLCTAILSAALSIAFFFLFRIRQVFDFRTGRGEKRTVRQMEDENAKTGKLRQDMAVSNTTSDLYRTPTGSIPSVIYPTTEKMDSGTQPTEAGLDSRADIEGSMDTQLLKPDMPKQAAGEEEPLPSRKFEILKERMWIHTDEMI